MRLVSELWKTPKRCALVAHVDPVSNPTARFLDTGNVLPGWDQHVYVSDVGVRQAMVHFGFPTPIEFEAMKQRAEEAEEALLVCDARLQEAEAILNASAQIASYVTGTPA